MQPEKANKIIKTINDPTNHVLKSGRSRTEVAEITTEGKSRIHREDSQAHMQPSTPGEVVCIFTVGGTIGDTLGAIAQNGYLVTEKPNDIDPTDMDPKLQLISHTYGPAGNVSAVFIDHNPRS